MNINKIVILVDKIEVYPITYNTLKQCMCEVLILT